jgi:hypothetical protein
VPDRTIFRETAIAAYRRGGEKDVIPRLISRPITVCRWLLLALLVAATALSWWVTVPTYLGASGVMVGPGDGQPLGARASAVLVLSPDRATHVRVGRPVRLQLGSAGADVRGAVAAVKSGLVTPDAARQRYPGLGPDLITQPSVVVVVRLEGPPPSGSAPGTRVAAQVETGPQRLISRLPGLPSRSAG